MLKLKKINGQVQFGILCNKSDIKPPVYTFGMKYLGKDGEVKVKCPNGYAYNLHADNFCN